MNRKHEKEDEVLMGDDWPDSGPSKLMLVILLISFAVLLSIGAVVTMDALNRGPKECIGQNRQECIADMRIDR